MWESLKILPHPWGAEDARALLRAVPELVGLPPGSALPPNVEAVCVRAGEGYLRAIIGASVPAMRPAAIAAASGQRIVARDLAILHACWMAGGCEVVDIEGAAQAQLHALGPDHYDPAPPEGVSGGIVRLALPLPLNPVRPGMSAVYVAGWYWRAERVGAVWLWSAGMVAIEGVAYPRIRYSSPDPLAALDSGGELYPTARPWLARYMAAIWADIRRVQVPAPARRHPAPVRPWDGASRRLELSEYASHLIQRQLVQVQPPTPPAEAPAPPSAAVVSAHRRRVWVRPEGVQGGEEVIAEERGRCCVLRPVRAHVRGDLEQRPPTPRRTRIVGAGDVV